MPPSHRRADDPEGFEPASFRRSPDELAIGLNGKTISARGAGTLFLVSIISIVLATLGSGYMVKQTVEQSINAVRTVSKTEHTAMKVSQDRTSCIITMSQEERIKFRYDYRPGAFKQWCPWAMDE